MNEFAWPKQITFLFVIITDNNCNNFYGDTIKLWHFKCQTMALLI